MSFAPENEYMRYGMIREFEPTDSRYNVYNGEIPRSMAPPSTADFEAGIERTGRKAQEFLDMFLRSPELASVYGPLTLEESNMNLGPSAAEEAALKELINLPGVREGIERARRNLGMVKGV